MLFTTVWIIASAATAIFAAPVPAPLAPLHRVTRRASTGGYIVKFKTGAVDRENRQTWIANQLRNAFLDPLTAEESATLKVGWRTDVFDGFAGTLSEDALRVFRQSGDVEWISEDAEAWVTDVTSQNDATWGLARISSQSRLSSTNDAGRDFTYLFDDSAGQGVDIYIVDTGVQVDHPELGGRATFSSTFGTGTKDVDVHGHGTHVAGIAASQSFGVAKRANIISVKVMGDNGRGDTSNIIAGVNFAVARAFQTNPRRPSVINISIISAGTPALDEAVTNAVNLGVHVVVGAGNDGIDAGTFSPARAPAAITVGATNIQDVRASFSNFGEVVDIFAPGENILSLSNTGGTRTLSGTSMATPFVSGLVAYFLALEDQGPNVMRRRIQLLSSKSAITSIPNGTINNLAYNGAVIQEPEPAPAPEPQPTPEPQPAPEEPAASSTTIPEASFSIGPVDPTDVASPNQPFTEDERQKVLGSVSGLFGAFQALADAAAPNAADL